MRVLLSVVGTRGDVQPVIALALEVRERGPDVRLCLPPNFIEWAQGLGSVATPVGIEMRAPRRTAGNGAAASKPMPDLITDQFDSIGAAAKGCDGNRRARTADHHGGTEARRRARTTSPRRVAAPRVKG